MEGKHEHEHEHAHEHAHEEMVHEHEHQHKHAHEHDHAENQMAHDHDHSGEHGEPFDIHCCNAKARGSLLDDRAGWGGCLWAAQGRAYMGIIPGWHH